MKIIQKPVFNLSVREFAFFALLFGFILAVFHTGNFDPEWFRKHVLRWIIVGLFWGY
ncbi:MAG: hypothetical protein LBT25_13470 [Candidatus Symbiothrix sp.]|jgi:hypothetical protein|nr:hypothetical protein [Candidatus Symbiothrix sp.]